MKKFPIITIEATGEQSAAISGFWLAYGKPLGCMLAIQPIAEPDPAIFRVVVLPPECASEINDVLQKHREAP